MRNRLMDLLTPLLLAIATAPSAAVAVPTYSGAAPVAYLVDLSSGAVLYRKNETKRVPPASMTKMLTAYVVFDMLSKGELKPSQTFVVRPATWQKWHGVGSTMYLNANQKVSVGDLLKGLITLSGNDAAIVLAEGISGSEAAFVKRMNETARNLGMKDSHFGTANGWPDGGRTLTTARDLAMLGERTIGDFPSLYHEYYGLSDFRWNGVTQPNRDPLLGAISGADGMKTGHTDEAGYCFTGSAQQAGRRLIMVVAGLPTYGGRASESVRFMHWGFDQWRSVPLFRSGRSVATIAVQLGDETRVKALAPRDLAVTLPKAGQGKYRLFVRYTGPVKAPVRKGEKIAQLIVKQPGLQDQIMPLVAANDVGEAGFLRRAWNGAKGLFGA